MDPGNPGDSIQALVLGSGAVGLNVIKQLSSNNRFQITWAGAKLKSEEQELTDDEKADLSIVRSIELDKTSSPMNINSLVEELSPDIVFLCQRGEDWGTQNQIASSNFERNMLEESIRMVDCPLITVSLEQKSKEY